MTRRLPLVAVALGVTFVSGCGKTDYQSMFSFWTVVSAEEGGQPPKDPGKKEDVFIDSEILTPDGFADVDVRWTDPVRHQLKLDPSKAPKQIDVSEGIYMSRGGVWPGIYELNGDDLKICLDLAGKTRPTQFKTTAGDQCLLLVLKRKKL
jgi:uncharacterized protein (TIGR03067 family)